MHMADALISPAVGGTMLAFAGGLMAVCARGVKRALRDDRVPLMGVLGAFVFAAQMINFSIPGTGSSGHLGGGLLLAILLGPQAAFLTIASVLTVQAFFFADGGLLALGCNMVNMGFLPTFVAYPLVYRPLAGAGGLTGRTWPAALAAAVVALQLGAFGVVLQTRLSGVSELPFGAFALMMLPIHAAIGVVEGLATAAVVAFVAAARPEVLQSAPASGAAPAWRRVLVGLAVAAAILGGVASWFASAHPDGLEWAIERVAGADGVGGPMTAAHRRSDALRERTAFLPDYGFAASGTTGAPAAASAVEAVAEAWPAVDVGTSVAGLVGGLLTLAVVCLVGFGLRACRRGPAGGTRAGRGIT